MHPGLRRSFARAVTTAGLFLVAIPGAAGAYTTAAGYTAHDYATGFPESASNHWGPLGVAFDQSDNLYVADEVDGNIYRFQPGGGVASTATRLTPSPIPGAITGLVVSRSGDLYLARYEDGDVVEVDPGTGLVIRRIARVPCATGLAIDPVSGDLFVSENRCGSTIWRVSGLVSGPRKVTAYAHVHGVDGLAFGSDGTLFAEADGTIARVGGTNSSSPGSATEIAKVPASDGLAIGQPVAGQPPFLVANRHDGIVTRIDLNDGRASQTNIFSGGSRGDFVAVDSDGCLYVTQSASIVRIAGAGGSCAFEPSTQGAPAAPAVIATRLSAPVAASPHRACTLLRSLTFRLRQQGRVRLRAATIYINGRRVEQLRGSAVTAPIRLSHLPRSSFTVKVVAFTTRGKQLITRLFFANCHKPATACVNTRSLTIRVPESRGTNVVTVRVYIRGRPTKVVRGHRITRISLKGLPRGRFTIKLVTRGASGKSATSTQTFVGCP